VEASGGNESRRNSILANEIFDNASVGIDLGIDGVTPNDTGDSDSGANDLLNFPIITAAFPTAVAGTACHRCIVEVFKADGDPSGHGEGHTFLARGRAGRDGKFRVIVSGLNHGDLVTATATDTQANTSEFSKNALVEDRKVIFIQGIDSKSGRELFECDIKKEGFIKKKNNRVGWVVDYLTETPWVNQIVPALDNPKDDFFYFSYSGFYCRQADSSFNYRKPLYIPEDTCNGIADATAKLRDMLEGLISEYPEAKFDIIAHSMGGMVAAALVELHDDMRAKVNSVITFDSPLKGVSRPNPFGIGTVCDTSVDPSWIDLLCEDYTQIPQKCASLIVPLIALAGQRGVPFFTLDATQIERKVPVELVPGDRTNLLLSASQLHCKFDDDHSSVWEDERTVGRVDCWIQKLDPQVDPDISNDFHRVEVKAIFVACAVTEPNEPGNCERHLKTGR